MRLCLGLKALLVLAALVCIHRPARAQKAPPSATLGADSGSAFGPEPAGLSELAYAAPWLALMRYHQAYAGYYSEVQDPRFFLSGDKDSTPLAELRAAWLSLSQAKVRDGDSEPTPCVFPARAEFLRRHGFAIPKLACPSFAKFKQELAASSASLVFAAAYANNPASMFGHTMLRLNKHKNTAAEDQGRATGQTLLNNSVAFLAQVDTQDDAVTYTINGVLGGYPGYYTFDPYYVTVAYYQDGESRDLWEYDLHLSQEQIDLLVANLFELTRQASFDYYFFSRNCAYQILSLLEVGSPGHDLVHSQPLIVLPNEVARTVQHHLAAGQKPQFRPSLKKSLLAAVAALNPERQEALRQLWDDPDRLGTALDQEVVDAYIKALNYRKFSSKNQLTPEEQQHLHQTLLHRSRLGPSSTAMPAMRQTPPHEAHPPFKTSLALGHSQSQGFLGISLKPGLHDLLSNDHGFDVFSAIDYLQIELRRYTREAVRLERLLIAEVNAFTPYSIFAPEWSWRLKLGFERPDGSLADGAPQALAEGGVGLTMANSAENMAAFGLLLGRASMASQNYKARLGPGLYAGAMLRLPEHAIYGLLGLKQTLDLLTTTSSSEIEAAVNFAPRLGFDMGVRFKAEASTTRRERLRETAWSVGYYF